MSSNIKLFYNTALNFLAWEGGVVGSHIRLLGKGWVGWESEGLVIHWVNFKPGFSGKIFLYWWSICMGCAQDLLSWEGLVFVGRGWSVWVIQSLSSHSGLLEGWVRLHCLIFHLFPFLLLSLLGLCWMSQFPSQSPKLCTESSFSSETSFN